MFLVNSRQSQFTVAHRNGHPFSRGYGANLPSSLERFLSRSLVYSTHLPVSVYGTGRYGFLGTNPNGVFRPKPRITYHRVCAILHHASHIVPWYRNINLLSIDYAFRPRLRSRLTLGGRAWPRKPWVYGDKDSHFVYRYSCLHSH